MMFFRKVFIQCQLIRRQIPADLINELFLQFVLFALKSDIRYIWRVISICVCMYVCIYTQTHIHAHGRTQTQWSTLVLLLRELH